MLKEQSKGLVREGGGESGVLDHKLKEFVLILIKRRSTEVLSYSNSSNKLENALKNLDSAIFAF